MLLTLLIPLETVQVHFSQKNFGILTLLKKNNNNPITRCSIPRVHLSLYLNNLDPLKDQILPPLSWYLKS